MMHPSMLEQMGREHRKDLQALAAPRARRSFALLRRRHHIVQPRIVQPRIVEQGQVQPISAAASGITPAGCAAEALSA